MPSLRERDRTPNTSPTSTATTIAPTTAAHGDHAAGLPPSAATRLA